MIDVTDARLANIRAAQRTISAARGADRCFLREPDDARLDQMLARVGDLAGDAARGPFPVGNVVSHDYLKSLLRELDVDGGPTLPSSLSTGRDHRLGGELRP